MAIALTAVVDNPNYKSWTVTCLDADTTVTVAHGFAGTPDFVQFIPQISVGNTALGNWAVVPGAANLVITKQSAVGSGGATPGTTVVGKIVALLPHSILQ